MIHLHYSNRLEALIEPLGSFVHGDQLRDPLSSPLNDYRAEPRHRGVSSNSGWQTARRRSELQIPVPARYLANIAERASSGGSKAGDQGARCERLQIAVFEYLRVARSISPKPNLAPVRAYLDATRR